MLDSFVALPYPHGIVDLMCRHEREHAEDPLWTLDLPAYVREQLRAYAAAQPGELQALAAELSPQQRAALQACFA